MLASSCNVLSPKRGEAHTGDIETNLSIVEPIEPDVLSPAGNNDSEQYAPRTLIIFYDPEVGTAPLDKAIADCGAEVIYRYHNFNGMAIVIPGNMNINDAIKFFEQVDGVLSVRRDRIYHLMD